MRQTNVKPKTATSTWPITARIILVNGIRVTFFKLREAESRSLQIDKSSPVRVATVPEIFTLKALVCAERSKSRDWFDLYTLIRSHGYTWARFHAVFMEFSNDSQYKNATRRLCSGIPQRDDEGYKTLSENPPSLEEMRDYFIACRDEFERAARTGEDRRGI